MKYLTAKEARELSYENSVNSEKTIDQIIDEVHRLIKAKVYDSSTNNQWISYTYPRDLTPEERETFCTHFIKLMGYSLRSSYRGVDVVWFDREDFRDKRYSQN